MMKLLLLFVYYPSFKSMILALLSIQAFSYHYHFEENSISVAFVYEFKQLGLSTILFWPILALVRRYHKVNFSIL